MTLRNGHKKSGKGRGRIPLITNLRIYVITTEEEWEESGDKTETKATAFIRRVIREDRGRHRFLELEFWGSTDDKRDFDCISRIDTKNFFNAVLPCIVDALAKRATELGEVDGKDDLVLATDLNGGRHPKSAPIPEHGSDAIYRSGLRMRGDHRRRSEDESSDSTHPDADAAPSLVFLEIGGGMYR